MKKFVLILLFLGLSIPSLANEWDSYNDPSHFDDHYEYRLNALPLKGMIDTKNIPWSESYWPRNKGSINLRWNSPRHEAFDYESPRISELKKMSRAELAQLAPSEKLDLARGRYDYPLKSYVARVNAKKKAKDFEGICDGWTASALQFPEPKPVDFTNPDGLVIPFGSSDVKALMSYFTSFHSDLGPIMVGRYCTTFGIGPRCDDLNPGAFHVILANEIGLKHQAFAADVEIGRETWNQPVYGFDFEVMGSARSSAPKAVRVHATMYYTDELDDSSWEPVTGTEKFVGATHELDYILEMDSSGHIIGGEWISTGVHPDLFWKPTKKIVFSGDFELLNQIYQSR